MNVYIAWPETRSREKHLQVECLGHYDTRKVLSGLLNATAVPHSTYSLLNFITKVSLDSTGR